MRRHIAPFQLLSVIVSVALEINSPFCNALKNKLLTLPILLITARCVGIEKWCLIQPKYLLSSPHLILLILR